MKVLGIAPDVVQWQRIHGRHDLPWQSPAGRGEPDPYRIWLSEVMLQQTQVATVIPYFEAFVAAFPTVAELAGASTDQVMALWSGLGYYSRARNLHAAARQVMARHGGVFPLTAEALATLPGVGRSTAAAIAAFAFGERAAILDGNVKRLFCRVFAIAGSPTQAGVMRELWLHAQAELPAAGEGASPAEQAAAIRAYTQGLMDLGATVCTRSSPACTRCPLAPKCLALKKGSVASLPSPRPRREVPVREFDMLLLCSGESVLIEQRPPSGIWGGLWSLPELDRADIGRRRDFGRFGSSSPGSSSSSAEVAEASELAELAEAAGLPACTPQEFARFEHVFTHFRMKARVWRAEVAHGQAPRALRQAPPTRWLALGEAATAPLPRPIKSLLQSLAVDAVLPGLH